MKDLYFVFEVGNNYCKIGRSKDVERRFPEICNGNPRRLELFAIIREHGHIEGDLHREYTNRAADGQSREWFKISRAEVEDICEGYPEYSEYPEYELSDDSDYQPSEISEEPSDELSEELFESYYDSSEEPITIKKIVKTKKTTTVTKKVKYQCTKCSKTFSNRGNLNQHLNRKNPCDKNRTYRCKKCSHVFNSKTDLERHKNRKTSCVTGEKDASIPDIHMCKYCKNEFATKYSLKRHYKSCKDKKKYSKAKSNQLESMVELQSKQIAKLLNIINNK